MLFASVVARLGYRTLLSFAAALAVGYRLLLVVLTRFLR